MSEWHIEQVIANTINDTARGDPEELAGRIVAALGDADRGRRFSAIRQVDAR